MLAQSRLRDYLPTCRPFFRYWMTLSRWDGWRTPGDAIGWDSALQVGRSLVWFPILSFLIGIILPAALWSWVWLCLLQKWVSRIFPTGKGGRCVGMTTLTPSYSDCLKTWETQLPGTFGACSGVYGDCLTFTFTFTFTSICVTGTPIDKLERILKESAVR